MNSLPFRIKICGVMTPQDAAGAIVGGADAIGLNFYRRSQRTVSRDDADAIRNWISTCGPIRSLNHRKDTTVVSVFVNPCLEEIRRALPEEDGQQSRRARHRVDWIQLHGDEAPELVAKIKKAFGLPIMRAFRWGHTDASAIDAFLEECQAMKCIPDALLIDSYKAGHYGGTGSIADWTQIARWQENRAKDIPLVLAGGLTPENVAEAITIVRPDAVDTAGGVELSPGRKDDARMRAFFETADRAFSAIGPQ